MKAVIFPGQGSQFVGMGKDLYESDGKAKELFDKANDVLGFSITDIMFAGTDEDLKQTNVTQPAIFLHSVILAQTTADFSADVVAGHSLGEFSALVANKALSFEDALVLVSKRAQAMQEACELTEGGMAAILALGDDQVEELCSSIDGVVPANYNCPGQLVISGTKEGIDLACVKAKEMGAKRALVLPVGGAFHSPLMEPARAKLAEAINTTSFATPTCPIYQNVTAKAESDIVKIKENLVAQLTAPVKWTQTVQNMLAGGVTEFVECGPGKVLQGLVKKVDRQAATSAI